MSQKWSTASFRIFSKVYSPEEIEEVLGVVATRKLHVGAPVSSSPGAPLRKENCFVHSSSLDDGEPLASHLNSLLPKIAGWAAFPSEMKQDCQASLFCGFSSENGQGGAVFTPKLLNDLARIGVELVLDLYPPLNEGEV